MFSLLWLEQAIASNKLYDLSNKGRDLSYADMFRIRR